MARSLVFDTVDEMNPTPADDETRARPAGPPESVWWRFVLVVLIAGAVTLAGSYLVAPSSHASVSPGPGLDVSEALQAPKGPGMISPTASVTALTVELEELPRWRYLWTRVSGTDTISLEAASPQAPSEMQDAQELAGLVAMKLSSGQEPQSQVAVTSVQPGSPAATAGIAVGDLLVAGRVDDAFSRFLTPADVELFLKTAHPRDKISLSINTRHSYKTVDVSLDASLRLGVTLSTAAPVGAPAFDIEGVTGPSAGLAMALVAIDSLGEGDLTGGLKIAATGAINSAGEVLEVGGVAQKVASMPAKKADIVFVPTSSVTAGRPTVVPVASVTAAVRYLCSRGATDVICKREALLK